MIEFERMRWYESLMLVLPWRRRAYERRLHAAISQLVADPSLPCKIEGTTIPHGFGMQTDPFRNVPDRY